jgi:hypothetical protein
LVKKILTKLNGRIAKNLSEIKAYNYLAEFIPKTMRIVYEEEDIPYVTESVYRPDYRISFRKDNGTVCFCEYKGNGRAFDSNVRRKMIAVKEQHPDKKFYLIFHSDGKIGPKRKNGTFMRQSDWANKNGFEFCIGVENVPQHWFED